MYIDPKLTARERWQIRILHKTINDEAEKLLKNLKKLGEEMDKIEFPALPRIGGEAK